MNNKEKLLKLGQSGKFVFHGSGNGNIKMLEPRQSTHIQDLQKPSESILDGKPSVAATPFIELAIFRSIVNEMNIPFSHNSGFGVDGDGQMTFRISSGKILEAIQGKRGFIYVLDKKYFEPYNRDGKADETSMEWRSYKPVKPIEIIEVNSDDLPDKNKIVIS